MDESSLSLKVLLPFGVFLEAERVVRVVVDTAGGSFGLLPRRLDCVAALPPGILTYETHEGVEQHLAIDRGILVKAGPAISVAVRRAIKGRPLGQLHEAVEAQFLELDEREREIRSVLARLESRFLRQFQRLNKA